MIALAQERRIRDALPPQLDHRYRDPSFAATAVKLIAGDCYVSDDPGEMLVTVLGSCVAACIRDPELGIGGMNHFMLPGTRDGRWDEASSAMRYGNVAMERLINEILKRGGRRRRLEVKVFGGGNVMRGCGAVGHQNAHFVRAYCASEGLTIDAQHLGGEHPRRVHYFPVTGKVMMLQLRRDGDVAAIRSESEYQRRLAQEPVAGSVELFQ
jgi:chemotaxis protein CheD